MLAIGDRFTAIERFETPDGVPRSIYMEGHFYSVTASNADLVNEMIAVGKAAAGELQPDGGVRLGAAPAMTHGRAKVH